MKIYKVSYIGNDDNTYNEFFTDKSEATRRQKELSKNAVDLEESEEDIEQEHEGVCKMVYDIHEFSCDISKQGILKMLNIYFKEQ